MDSLAPLPGKDARSSLSRQSCRLWPPKALHRTRKLRRSLRSPATGETLAAIEDEFESFRRFNEDFIDRSKTLLLDLEALGGETSGQFSLDDKVTRPVKNVVLPKLREPLNRIIEGANTGNDVVERIVLVFGFLRN